MAKEVLSAPPEIDVAYGAQCDEAVQWITARYGRLGVWSYRATDKQGCFGRIVIPVSELPLVISALKMYHPAFAEWIEGVTRSTLNAAAHGPS